ncbi:MAG: single-stranded-DNA-specific exonuclease RecJ, partial [Syntrophales bacterium]|nr:single-stranded-DNA-specific exonuclease RecJ [Syntrophales bacterium]
MNERSLPTTQWRLAAGNKSVQDLLIRELGINPIISSILTNRDISNTDEARKYLSPSLSDLHNPFLMKDMQKGVHRLIQAIYNKEKIIVYGDYDADGITSVVVLLKFLKEIFHSADYYIPDRINEGYGLNKNAIDKMKSKGVKLIITVDCGVSDLEEVSYAQMMGIDIIILDHHKVPDNMPSAVAVINPNRADCPFPFKHLAAVGIVFNFLIAVRSSLRKDGFWKDNRHPNLKCYLDLVALGTIGDISPLIDENRIFTKIGLDLITEGKRTGLRTLKEISGLENQPIDAQKVSFCLTPMINAAGRVGSPRDAVQLLLADDVKEAREMARKLDGYNRKRQAMERGILNEILDEIKEMADHEKATSLVLASSKWHPGVIGIVASRLVEQYCRPVILISLKDGVGKGSGRSIDDFNIYEGLKKCDSLLLSYGGHQYAAGITIREEDVKNFTGLFNNVIREDMKTSDFTTQTIIDAQCGLNDITHDLLYQIGALAPFGRKNPEPIFCVKNVNITTPTVVGNNHLRMRVNGDGVSCNSIWFSKGHFIHTLSGSALDIVFTPQINHWKGSDDLQLKMMDMAPLAH